MIQDITPSRLDNSFKNYEIGKNDYVLCFDSEGRILADTHSDSIIFPKNGEISSDKKIYGFSVDNERYFIAVGETVNTDTAFEHMTLRQLRDRFCGKELFAAFTAYHLWKWYNDNSFCGRCGDGLVFSADERALKCSKCGNVVYPRINPAVRVGVIKGDSILVTRYRRGYAHNALVAGFTEIGETLEQTVEREVMEETGVKAKNIRYYKSQPWGMAQDILIGFFCEADGSAEIHMDGNELKYAEWVSREELVLQPTDISLTNEMMKVFREGKTY